MRTDPPAPDVPIDRFSGWECVEEGVEYPFKTPVVTVAAYTTVFEDRAGAATFQDATGIDTVWRFCFVSRIQMTPHTRPSALLDRIVRRGAADGFTDRLQERGLDAVTKRRTESVQVGSHDGTCIRYGARCRVDGTTIPLEGLVVVWTMDSTYYIGGGVYPVAIPTDVSHSTGDSLTDPERDREMLFALFSAVGETSTDE
ncbi:hypothetical protein [Natronocalculus amylovorans]|uniref:Uncharacterized protein n=1 Tax=Natronocalculus amylovorans TaxID=2917812 RepID=A0AAE3FXE3_9EURY|nr:hypothetical protein [Natronocalculus amylovorans]MCL9817089.1 hypothetical protein [Natronocalculus amylovorans]NUE02883.1 hypothetical protein [Halorubraceae archaeon YAN]